MPKPFSFGKVAVGLTTGEAADYSVAQEDDPFRILILGDFSGRATWEQPSTESPLADRRPIVIDRDNFDQVLGKLGVTLQLLLAPDASARLSIPFGELEDFHPDRLIEHVEVFQTLRDLREQLNNPSTFAAAAAQMRGWAASRPAPPTEAPPTSAPAPAPPATENLLEQMLGEMPSQTPEPRALPGGINWGSFLHQITRSHVAPAEDPRQAELVTQVDAAASALMRVILHHPAFQALEAAWRSLYFLVRRLDTDSKLKLFLLDISKKELAADLLAGEDLTSPQMYRWLVEQTVGTPGAQPWAVVVGDYTFDQSAGDVQALGRMAQLARQAGAPFLAAASPHLLGCESLAKTTSPRDWDHAADAEGAERWQRLRQLPAAAYLGLALPRFLLRLPYGKETSAIERFEFEEMAGTPAHEAYLWGNPAFACAYLLGQGYSHAGWNLRPGALQDIDGLPAHTYQVDGESQVQPVAEAVLTESGIEHILEKGLIPVASVLNGDAAQVIRFQSLAEDGRTLAGRWQ